MQDCYHERDSGIGDFEERDSGNNHFDEPRIEMSVDENLFFDQQATGRYVMYRELLSTQYIVCPYALHTYSNVHNNFPYMTYLFIFSLLEKHQANRLSSIQ